MEAQEKELQIFLDQSLMEKMLKKFLKRIQLTGEVFLHGDISIPMRESIPAITNSEVEDIRSFFPLDKFFIFGHARSGTTLLTRLVRLHSDVHCNYQGHFFTRIPTIESLVNNPEIEAWLTRRSNRWNQGRDLSPIILRAVIDFILEREARGINVKIVGDKSPNSLLNGQAVRLMHKYYPDGRLLFIVRDGRDAAISHRFQTFIDAVQHLTKDDLRLRTDFESDPAPFIEGERSIFTERSIRNAAIGWATNVSETDYEARTLLGDYYLSLRYEDLLAEPWTEMRKVWKFLDVDLSDSSLETRLNEELERNPDKEWQQKKAGSLINPLQKGKTGSWKDLFTARDKEIFKKFAGEMLMTWGYEKDMNW